MITVSSAAMNYIERDPPNQKAAVVSQKEKLGDQVVRGVDHGNKLATHNMTTVSSAAMNYIERDLPVQKAATVSQKKKLGDQVIRGVDHGNKSEDEVEQKSERQAVEYSFKTVTAMGKEPEAKEEKRNYQELNKIFSQGGKRAVQTDEEKIVLDSPHHTLLGKRKGNLEGLEGDDQRQLKIRKWGDYLEAESKNEEESAEAALQPRQQP
jgi:hypothetical protein